MTSSRRGVRRVGLFTIYVVALAVMVECGCAAGRPGAGRAPAPEAAGSPAARLGA